MLFSVQVGWINCQSSNSSMRFIEMSENNENVRYNFPQASGWTNDSQTQKLLSGFILLDVGSVCSRITVDLLQVMQLIDSSDTPLSFASRYWFKSIYSASGARFKIILQFQHFWRFSNNLLYLTWCWDVWTFKLVHDSLKYTEFKWILTWWNEIDVGGWIGPGWENSE